MKFTSILIGAIMCFFLAMSVSAEVFLAYDDYDAINFDLVLNGYDGAQSWNTSVFSKALITNMSAQLKQTSGTPTSNILVEIWTGTEDTPTTKLYDGWYISPDQVSTDYQWVTAHCDPAYTCDEAFVDANTRYWLYVKDNNQYSAGINIFTGTYPDGNTWAGGTNYPTNDLLFRISGIEASDLWNISLFESWLGLYPYMYDKELTWNEFSTDNTNPVPNDCRLSYYSQTLSCNDGWDNNYVVYDIQYTIDGGDAWEFTEFTNYSGCTDYGTNPLTLIKSGVFPFNSTVQFRIRAFDGNYSEWGYSDNYTILNANWTCTDWDENECTAIYGNATGYLTCINATDMNGVFEFTLPDVGGYDYPLPPQNQISDNYNFCDECMPIWSCTNYDEECSNTYIMCTEVVDENNCYALTSDEDDLYSGNYLEFSPRCQTFLADYDDSVEWWNSSWAYRSKFSFDSLYETTETFTFYVGVSRYECGDEDCADLRAVDLNGNLGAVGPMLDGGEPVAPTSSAVAMVLPNVLSTQEGLWGYVYHNNPSATWTEISENTYDYFSVDSENWANINVSWFIESYCIPEWVCTSYSTCQPNNIKPCLSAVSSNTCDLTYTGDYSELGEACTFVTYTYGNSTNLSEVPDIEAVEDFTAATPTTEVVFTTTVNLSGVEDITTQVIIETGVVIMNVTANPSLNVSATVSMDIEPVVDYPCDNFLLYYASGGYTTRAEIIANGQLVATSANIGGDCSDPTICTNVECSNNILTFEAQHFDGFGIDEYSEAEQGIDNIQVIVFAAFSILATILLVTSAFVIIKIFESGEPSGYIIATILTIIGLTIVLFVGYIIISLVAKAIMG